MRSTLACEASSAARAFDRGCFGRVMLYEIEYGLKHKWNRGELSSDELRSDWANMCNKIPFALGTDCRSLYDVCTKSGSLPEERRVALDIMDIKESIEEMGDQMRWVPTYHMLVDCMTKCMPPDMMLTYLKTMQYAFKYDDVIKNTKREVAKRRKELREGGNSKHSESNLKHIKDLKLPLEDSEYDDLDQNNVNVVDHYPLYYAMLTLQTPPPVEKVSTFTIKDFPKLKRQLGCRRAYQTMIAKYCVS